MIDLDLYYHLGFVLSRPLLTLDFPMKIWPTTQTSAFFFCIHMHIQKGIKYALWYYFNFFCHLIFKKTLYFTFIFLITFNVAVSIILSPEVSARGSLKMHARVVVSNALDLSAFLFSMRPFSNYKPNSLNWSSQLKFKPTKLEYRALFRLALYSPYSFLFLKLPPAGRIQNS